MAAPQNTKITFWEHLEELRWCLVRIIVAVVLCSIVAFCCKEGLFQIILAPKSPNFITNRLIGRIAQVSPEVNLINIDLAQQFLTHMKVALCVGLLCVGPYVLYVLFRFVSPALYDQERRVAVRTVVAGYVLFLLGVGVNYFVIFPLTFQFLATYQVSMEVANVISLSSYISALLVMSLMLGVMFELPVLCWLLAKAGMLSASIMRKYRRHAVVVILIISAIITPTGDPFTLTLVAVPIYLLYEVGLWVVKATTGRVSEVSI